MMCVSGRMCAVRCGRTVYGIWYVYRWRATNAGVNDKMMVTGNCEVVHFKKKKIKIKNKKKLESVLTTVTAVINSGVQATYDDQNKIMNK